uniref:Ig-like domain-containing protein n=1 Tax=Sphaeramia orbicularis TaxID=375764 RepID=A0A672ZFT5_9TELE
MTFDWKKDGDDKEVFCYVKGDHYNNGRSGQSRPFKGRVSHFQDELKFGNASIKIRNTKLADSGNYTCIFPDKQKSHITLYVVPELKVRPNISGAVLKPWVTILGVTEDGTQLECEVKRASPKPDVIWQDHAGNTIPSQKPQMTDRGGSYDIILLTTVTKTDNYTCTATQKEIKHRVSAKIYVPVNVSDSSPPWITGGFLCTILLLVLAQCCVCISN